MRVVMLGLCLLSAPLAAQAPAPAKLALHPPGIAAVTVSREIPYRGRGDSAYTFDLYRSKAHAGARPAFVIFNVLGRNFKNDPLNSGWARLAASEGYAGIAYQVENEADAVASFDSLLAYLARNGKSLGVRADTVVVWAGSTNARVALPTANDRARQSVRALIMYYGAGETPFWRPDVPTLVVRAGLDQPPLQRLQLAMIDSMFAYNLPITIINHPHATHPFEDVVPDEASSAVIRQTFDFVKMSLSRPVRDARAKGALAAHAASALYREEWAGAIADYEQLRREHPRDFNLTQRLADALLGARRFGEAGAMYDTALAEGSWRKVELALGGIAAYAQAGQLEKARGWLEKIPPQWGADRIIARIGPAVVNVAGVREMIAARRTP